MSVNSYRRRRRRLLLNGDAAPPLSYNNSCTALPLFSSASFSTLSLSFHTKRTNTKIHQPQKQPLQRSERRATELISFTQHNYTIILEEDVSWPCRHHRPIQISPLHDVIQKPLEEDGDFLRRQSFNRLRSHNWSKATRFTKISSSSIRSRPSKDIQRSTKTKLPVEEGWRKKERENLPLGVALSMSQIQLV